MKPAIARQNLVKHHPDQAAGLAGIAEGRLGCLQLREALPQQCRDVRGRIGPFPLRLGGGKQIGTGPPDGRIKGPRGEIEIPEEERGWIGGTRRFRGDRHRQASYGSPRPSRGVAANRHRTSGACLASVRRGGRRRHDRQRRSDRHSHDRRPPPGRAGVSYRAKSRGYGCTERCSGVVCQRWCAGSGGPFGSSLRCVACPSFGPGRYRRCFPP